ncbi:hypothetical protein [Streptomyces sp. NBC_00154]|uniref:hypothetical protein n=1 Tax=Streptomyces sp. NBC_00154 TaxID=2975670 RepID=UPI00225A7FAD|nr:hypothetical protein [Streptomyces sp. NBC_00154]MCX5315876.1 hypothetical protein [Streptomyces sp. NBC_00154]
MDVCSSFPADAELICRNRTTGKLAYYRCWSLAPVALATVVRVAGSRWRVEETFQDGKGLAGLDEHQVRRYPPGPAESLSRCSPTPSSPSSATCSSRLLQLLSTVAHRLRPTGKWIT